jgi:hypothetical protein
MGARTIGFYFPLKSSIKILSAVLSIIQHVKNANEIANEFFFIFFILFLFLFEIIDENPFGTTFIGKQR